MREPLGAALYLTGQLAEAERTFRDDLRLNPGNGRSLFDLWQTMAALSRTSEADTVKQQLHEAWKDADVPLSVEIL
jgi:hypothetical protein